MKQSPVHYYYWGLHIASDIEIPDWAGFEQQQSIENADVEISISRLTRAGSAGAERPPICCAQEYSSVVKGIGRCEVHQGKRIVVWAEQDFQARSMRAWLMGPGWATLCYQRGLFLLHASAVMAGDSAVLFCAPTKGGKSTIAAELFCRGYPLISDDLCLVNVSPDGAYRVFPGPARMKLWRDGIERLGPRTGTLEPDYVRDGKFLIPVPMANPAQPAPLREIYLLEWGVHRISRLFGSHALRAFVTASRYRPMILLRTERLSEHHRKCLELLQRVPLWELRRPRDLKTLSTTVDSLEKRISRII